MDSPTVRLKTRTVSFLSALLVMLVGMMSLPTPAQAVPFFAGSGHEITLSDGTSIKLQAIAPPAGADQSLPVWCIDLSKSQPGREDVVSIATLTESKMWGPAELDLTVPQLAVILDEYQLSTDADTLAAIAYLVHANLEESTPQPELGISDSQSAVDWLVDKISTEAPTIHARAIELAQHGRDSAAVSYGNAAGGEPGTREGIIEGIGVKNGGGNWIAGRDMTVTMNGPAVFADTGTQEWKGKSQAASLQLAWTATGNGEVTFSTQFDATPAELNVLRNPDVQDTIQFPKPVDPEFITIPGNTWWVNFDFQPVGVSHVEKISDTGTFTDTFTAAADPDYGSGQWLTLDNGTPVPVTYKVSAYHTGNVPPAQSATVPDGAELIGTQTVVAHGPGELSADFTTDKHGFATVVWEVIKADQPSEYRDYIAGDWADSYGIPAETTSYRHPVEVDSTLSIRTTKSGTYFVDDLWVTGFPADHGDFTGDDRFGPDTQAMNQALYFFPAGTTVSDDNADAGQLIAQVDVPAKNGFYPSVGSTEFKALTGDDGEMTPGTYVFVTSFAGDDRVKPFTSSFEDVTEQFTVTAEPSIHTTLMYEQSRGPVPGFGTRTLVDVVTYTNLEPGKTYDLEGTLMDKATAEPLQNQDGQPVTSRLSFTPETANGTVEVVFEVDAALFAGKTTVAFEKLTQDGREVAIHADITDENQTLTFEPGTELKTTATDTSDGDKLIERIPSASITDKVCDVNKTLIPGTEYEIVTALMESDGEPVRDKDGAPVTVTTRFTPQSSDECAEVVIEFDATLVRGKTVVVFEDVLLDGEVIGIHHDLDDADQTVTIEEPTPPAPPPAPKPTPLPKTGATVTILAASGLGLAALGGILVLLRRRGVV